MRKLSVPYTIRRNGIFYLNLRWNNQIIRQSLATKDPMKAFRKVNQIAPIFANPHSCEVALRQQISDLLGESRRSEANGLKLAQPNEANLLSQGFSLYKHEQMLENWSTRTAAQNDVTFLQRLELIGDLPVMAVTKSVVRDYGKYYLTIPLIGTRVTNHTSADKGGIRSN